MTIAVLTAAASAFGSALVSSNWSGYAVQPVHAGHAFSSVSGTWRQPEAACTRGHETFLGVWVGLGGFSHRSRALEQIGTDADCNGAGRAVYSSWWELVPAAPVAIRLTTRPGDVMQASVTVRGRGVTLRLRDLTSGARFSATRHLGAVDASSAEWIVEAPSACVGEETCTTLPLTDFGSAAFLDLSATAGGHTGTAADSAWTATALELRESSGARHATRTVISAEPSGLAAGGGSFSVLWTALQPAGEASPPAPAGVAPTGAIRRAG